MLLKESLQKAWKSNKEEGIIIQRELQTGAALEEQRRK